MKAKLILVAVTVLASQAASADWTAKVAYDPVKDESHCVVESPAQTIDDGYQDTRVFLRLDSTTLIVMTRSNVDTDDSDVGVRVDKHELIKPDSVYLEQNVVFKKDISKIIEQFKEGRRATFTLKFWPTYPDTGAKTATFSLIGFTKAYAHLPDCG
ncbi:MAG: hypothetical protein ACE5HM_00040 [Acidiferrobacterales bacterium]